MMAVVLSPVAVPSVPLPPAAALVTGRVKQFNYTCIEIKLHKYGCIIDWK